MGATTAVAAAAKTIKTADRFVQYAALASHRITRERDFHIIGSSLMDQGRRVTGRGCAKQLWKLLWKYSGKKNNLLKAMFEKQTRGHNAKLSWVPSDEKSPYNKLARMTAYCGMRNMGSIPSNSKLDQVLLIENHCFNKMHWSERPKLFLRILLTLRQILLPS